MDEEKAITIVHGLAENRLMKEAEDYVRRGRRHELLELSALKDHWVSAFRNAFSAEQNKDCMRDFTDYDAELQFRREERPFDRVHDELAALRTRLEHITPEEHLRALKPEIDEYLSEQDKPKN